MKLNHFKKTIYIILFTFLGILLGLVVHGLVELWYIDKLTTNFPKYSLSHSWADWFFIHKVWSVVTLVGGIVFGYLQGKYWWKLVYEQRNCDPFFRKVRKFFHLSRAKNQKM